MGAMTQSELAEKYEVDPSFVCNALRGIEPAGSKRGEKRLLVTFDEKTAAAAICRELSDRAERKRKIWRDAKDKADRAESIRRASGLIDNPRWRL